MKRASLDKSRRIEFLDVLRGLAAFIVFCQHSMEYVSVPFKEWSGQYVNLGEVGVVVFFMVSGFIIPVSLEKYNSLPRFWMGRILRLWPIYLASLVVAVALNSLNVLGTQQFPDSYDRHPVLFVLGNMTMFQQYIGIPVAIGVYWTLALELVFYALCSLLFLFGLLRRTLTWLWVSIAVLLTSQVAIAIAFDKSLPAGRMGLIVTAFFGTLLYRQRSEGKLWKTMVTVLPVLFCVFALTFWLRTHFYTPPAVLGPQLPPRPTTLCQVISWISAYLVFLGGYALRSWEFPKLFTWIGQISYPLYLFHCLVLAVTPATLPWPVFLLGTLTVSLLIAHLTHNLIERPIARFQHTLLPQKAVTV
jgi:peptidoglycan/LPS O-acetylase OafA/YrhL